MAILRRDDTVLDPLGNAMAGVSVTYLLQPANVSALTPKANVYSNTTGTTASNPQITDGFGHATAYLNNGQLYTVVYQSPQLGTVVYPDQSLGDSSGGSSIVPLSEVPVGTIDGTNRVFALSHTYLQATVWNNFPLIPGLGYVLSGTVLTYATAPQVGDSLFVQGF